MNEPAIRTEEQIISLFPACKIRRFVVVWNYENEREGRWGY